jgi:hypothetical protein
MSPKGSPTGIGSPEQERIDSLHERAERLANVVMPERHGPAAVLEAAFDVFLSATGGLHYAIEGHEFRNDEFAHGFLLARLRASPLNPK